VCLEFERDRGWTAVGYAGKWGSGGMDKFIQQVSFVVDSN
jgi:hypothetical protein